MRRRQLLAKRRAKATATLQSRLAPHSPLTFFSATLPSHVSILYPLSANLPTAVVPKKCSIDRHMPGFADLSITQVDVPELMTEPPKRSIAASSCFVAEFSGLRTGSVAVVNK